MGLGVDLLPNIDLPTVSVTVTNPGASPEQIETEITKAIEGAVNTISGIDELRSSSVEGVSQVNITFLLEKNGDVAAQEVRDRVALVAATLPETAEPPVIQKFDPGAMPILQIAVSGNLPLRDLTDIADEQIKERLESISGVGQVQLVGGAEREIQVRLDPDRMRSFNVTLTEVAAALRQQNLELPAGRIPQGSQELTVRTMGKITDPQAFKTIPVAERAGYVVRLGDIAEVVDGQEELRTASFLNGKSAVTLVVQKQSGQNTVTVAEEVKARLAGLAATLPPGVSTAIVHDQSVFIRRRHLVARGAPGARAASWRASWSSSSSPISATTLIAAVAIPTSIVSTFALIAAMGYTLNQLTMLGLTLMVGVVIDDAIIVLENIYRYHRREGHGAVRRRHRGHRGDRPRGDGDDAVADGGLRPGRLHGRDGRPLHVVVRPDRGVRRRGVAARVVHADADAELALHQGPARARRARLEGLPVLPPDRPHLHGDAAVVDVAPHHRGRRLRPGDCQHRPAVPGDREGLHSRPTIAREFQVAVRAPEGSGLAATTTILERIASDLRQFPEVVDTLTTVGANFGGGMAAMMGGGGAPSVNAGSIYVTLRPLDERKASQQDVMIRAREVLRRYPGELRTSIQEAGGGGGGMGVQYSIAGPDLTRLAEYSDTLVRQVQALPIAVDADTSLVIGRPELRVEIDRQRAADLGIRVQDIAQALNMLVGGSKTTSYYVGDDQYNVTHSREPALPVERRRPGSA